MDIEVQQFYMPAELVPAIRRLGSTVKIDPEWLPTRIVKDMWATEKPVGEHIDNTSDFKTTYGMVLINDAGQLLNYRGQIFGIPAGTMYRMDARYTHSTVGNNGLFVFYTWDKPHIETLAEIREHMLAFLRSRYMTGAE